MGTTNSANNEWIELKNISGSEINLDNWQFLDKDKKIKIIFTDQYIIQRNGFFLLERTDDESLPRLSADLIYTGTLGNINEALYLFDKNCQLQDEVLASPNWPAGDNSSKRTMERRYDLEWQTSGNIGGTPKKENISGYYEYYGGGGGGTTPTSSPVKILITEVQIASASSTNDDFIELYNPNLEDVNLTNWYIQRKTENASDFSTYAKKDSFSAKKILAKSYFLIANASSTFSADITTTYPLTENNTLYLKNPEGEIIDMAGWGQAQDSETAPAENPQPGKSIGRKWSTTTEGYIDTDNNYEDFKIQEPTPKSQNKAEIEPESEPENQIPIASFTYTPQNPAVGEQIFFHAASSTDPDGKIISFIWDFGDGNSTTTSQTTTTHFFTTSSDFIITLMVIDNVGATSSPATTTIGVTETPEEETPSFSVVINEIGWMGTKNSSSDEWMELYNTTSTHIDLNNWTLGWSHDTTIYTITFSTSTAATTTIPANGFYLIERTNDDTVSDIPADWSGSFGYGLNNNGEKLELRDANGNLIDIIDCSSGWFAGTTTPAYISMERINSNDSGINPQNWASNNLITRNGLDAKGNKINGTPKSENSVSKSETQTPTLLPFDEFDELTFTYLGSPYIIRNTLYVLEGKTLKIEPGVTIKFVPRWGAEIRGTLEAVGKEGKEIIFTANSDGYWSGIKFKNHQPENQITSRLEHIKIEKARICLNMDCTRTTMLSVDQATISLKNSVLESDNWSKIAIYLNNSSSTLENIVFSKFNISIHIQGGSQKIKNCSFFENSSGIHIAYGSNTKIEGNTFRNNGTPIYLNAASSFFEGNIVEDNILDGISVGAGYLPTTTWQADLPYILEKGAVAPNSILTLEPGTIVKFKNGGGMEIYGKIIAQGTSAQQIIFTSLKDDSYGGDTNNDATTTQPARGSWRNIRFRSSDSVLDNVIIKYGGREVKDLPWSMNVGAISLNEDVEISIKNSLIEENVYAISFPNTTSCETINARINQFETENTIFKDNKYLTYPKCP